MTVHSILQSLPRYYLNDRNHNVYSGPKSNTIIVHSLQSRRWLVQGFPCVVNYHREPLFSLQGPCNHYREFSVRITIQGNPCSHYIQGMGLQCCLKGCHYSLVGYYLLESCHYFYGWSVLIMMLLPGFTYGWFNYFIRKGIVQLRTVMHSNILMKFFHLLLYHKIIPKTFQITAKKWIDFFMLH